MLPAPEGNGPDGEEDLRDAGPRDGRRRDPQRTCIVLRKVCPESELIRFVLDPEGRVVADLKRRLPGRGVWVTATAGALDQAVTKRGFARGFRQPVNAPEGLVAEVAAGLRSAALGSIGLARKAGQAVTGFAKVDALARAGEAGCLLHASEASVDGVEKLAAAARAGAAIWETDVPPVWRLFEGIELDLALGGMNVVHAAAYRSGQGAMACAAVARLARFGADQTAPGKQQA